MNKKHVTLLSISISTLVLSGCYERGEAIPITQKKSVKKPIKKSKVVKIYDFPVLKLSANDKHNNIKINPKIEKKSTESTSTSLRFPKISQKEKKSKNSVKSIYTTQKIISTPLTKDKKIIQKEALDKVIKETKKLQEKAKEKKKKNNNTTKQSSLSNKIPILSSLLKTNISLHDIPIINKILPKPSTVSKGRIKAHSKKNTHSYTKKDTSIPMPNDATTHHDSSVAFSGGTSSSNLDMAKIRVETDDYQTNIILDSYKWAGYNATPTEASAVSGQYFFRYDSSSHRIVGDIRGYNSFSALIKKQATLLQDNPIVKNIYLDRYIGDNGIQFIIELYKNMDVKVNIIDVEDPGSIIIELYPKKRNVVYNP